MSDEELLLMQLPDEDDNEEHRRPQKPPRRKTVLKVRNPKYVSKGATHVMKDWPSHHAHTNFWLILSTFILLIFFVLLYISCFKKKPLGPNDEQRKKCIDLDRIKQLHKRIFGLKNKTPAELCTELSDKDRALIESQNSTADTHSLINDFNVFYVHDDSTPFSHLKACTIESAMRYAPDKQFFFIKLTKCSPKTPGEESAFTSHSLTFNLTAVLKNEYPNLKSISTESCKYFTGSPFQGLWQDGSVKAYQAAQILTAWRFGGTVLSLNALVTNRKLFDQVESSVEVSKLLLRSRLQCNKFIHEMMLEMRKEMVPTGISNNFIKNSSNDDLISDVINKSLENHCHNLIGCNGVKKTDSSKICNQVGEQCFLLNFKNWRTENSDWKKSIRYFCPVITRRSLNFSINEDAK